MGTPQSWSTVIDHSGDAGFRAWVAEFITKAAAAGLVQTSDTGQINTVTVTRPAVNTEGGYAIFRMNDVQQATAPAFFRVGFGTGAAAGQPRMQITVGTGTNGAGTITGTALTTARTCTFANAPSSAVISYQSLMCATEGFFGFSWKIGSNSSNANTGATFLFERSRDTAGAPSAIGAMVLWGSGSPSAFTALQFLRFASPAAAGAVGTTSTDLPFTIPGSPASSLNAAGNNQTWVWFMAVPDVLPILGVCQIVRTEVSVTSTFSATLIGVTAHTYIAIGQGFQGNVAASTAYGTAMLWEA